MDYPRLREPILLSLLAVLCLVVAMWEERLPDWLRGFLVFAGVIFLAWAIFTTIDLIRYRVNLRMREQLAAAAVTERVLMLRELRHMNRDQMDALSRWTPTLEIIAATTGPVTYLNTFGVLIPMVFIAEFLQDGEGPYLCRIRKFGEGTKERQWAELFTRYVVGQGWAERSNGPYAARWKNQELAWKSLGFDVSG